MAAAPQERYYTPEEYLALEREAEFKSEYLNGRIYAMAGVSPEHSTISANVNGELHARLKGNPCRVLSSDMKVRTTRAGLFAYPDVTVACGELRFHDERRDVLINPVVIVEVLSPSTEANDRGRKFVQYQHLETLSDYVLIAQDTPHVDHFVKQADGQWLLTVATGLDSQIVIASIGCTLRLSEVYDRVTFPLSHPKDQDVPARREDS